MDIASRLDQAMKDAGFTSQSALARASGIPQPTINRILKSVGKKGPEAHTLVQLAAACNVTFEWLHEGIEPRARSGGSAALPPGGYSRVVVAEEDDPRFYRIQIVQPRLSAGMRDFQGDPDYSDGGFISVPTTWVEKNQFAPARLVAIKVTGDSMEPSLYEDDVVLVNTADTRMVDGAVFAVNYEGVAVVKRLSRDAGQWWLTSDSADQRRHHRKLCQGDACVVVGRVVRKESDRI